MMSLGFSVASLQLFREMVLPTWSLYLIVQLYCINCTISHIYNCSTSLKAKMGSKVFYFEFHTIFVSYTGHTNLELALIYFLLYCSKGLLQSSTIRVDPGHSDLYQQLNLCLYETFFHIL